MLAAPLLQQKVNERGKNQRKIEILEKIEKGKRGLGAKTKLKIEQSSPSIALSLKYYQPFIYLYLKLLVSSKIIKEYNIKRLSNPLKPYKTHNRSKCTPLTPLEPQNYIPAPPRFGSAAALKLYIFILWAAACC